MFFLRHISALTIGSLLVLSAPHATASPITPMPMDSQDTEISQNAKTDAASPTPSAPESASNAPKSEVWQALPKSTLKSQTQDFFQKEPPSTGNPACGYWDCLSLEPLQNTIYYTVQEPMTVSQQAAKWGVPRSVLIALNPSLTAQSTVEPGQKYLVENRLESAPAPYSRGKANRGKMRNPRLMPEGDGYFMRTIRNHSWGVDTTIQAMMTVFKQYAQTYPDAPPINVGDISKRRGGKLSPHASHQSGRDIDIGFVHHPDSKPRKHPEHFIRATSDNLDVEKTWFITKTLIQTGLVQVIYIDKFVQRKLWQYASKELTKEQQELIFSLPKHEKSSSAILQHWPGHRNHFHIRFKCPKGQYQCRK